MAGAAGVAGAAVDMAAAAGAAAIGAVAAEAGALVTALDGAASWSGMIVAAPPVLHEPLLDLLREAGAGSA